MLRTTLVCVFSGMLSSAVFVPSFALAARIQTVAGEVKVNHVRQKVFDTIWPDSVPVTLDSGDFVRTEMGGRARVVFDDGTEIVMAPSSELRITEAEKGEGSLFSLVLGRVRALVKAADRTKPWRMKAGNVTMGVRGTDFTVSHGRDKGTVCAFSGTVAVETSGKPPVLVSKNEGVVVQPSGEISEPVAMDAEQIRWWKAQTWVPGAEHSAESRQDAFALLGRDWFWQGPVAVDAVDPEAMKSEFQNFHFNGDYWMRLFRGTGPGEDRTDGIARGRLAAAAALNRRFLLFAEGILATKTGKHNPETGGAYFQQGFLLGRTRSGHSLALGRQEWEFGDGLIVGKDPWRAIPRSQDGALFTFRTTAGRLRLATASLRDRVTSFRGEDWLAVAYLDLSKLPLDVYGVWQKRNGLNEFQTWNGGERLNLAGSSPFFLEEEASYQYRTAPGRDGLSSYLVYGAGGVRWANGALVNRLQAVFLQAGDYQQVLPDSHRFLGLVNAFGEFRHMRRVGASLLQSAPVLGRRLSWTLDHSWYFRQGVSSNADLLAREFDVLLGFETHPNVFVQVGSGYFRPEQAYGSSQDSFNLFLLTQLAF